MPGVLVLLTSLLSYYRRPNEALLSINCFQKDLGDPNPLVRAWALRAMAGIRLHVIAPLVLVAVTKCARDPSVYVRKCAANALPKLHDLRMEENTTTIEEVRLYALLNYLFVHYCYDVTKTCRKLLRNERNSFLPGYQDILETKRSEFHVFDDLDFTTHIVFHLCLEESK